MKQQLTKEQANNLIRLGVKISSSDVQSDGHITWSFPALLNLFPCGKNDPIFNLTRGGYPDGTYSRNWYASYEDLDRNILFVNDAEEPIDAVYQLLCELLKEHKL